MVQMGTPPEPHCEERHDNAAQCKREAQHGAEHVLYEFIMQLRAGANHVYDRVLREDIWGD